MANAMFSGGLDQILDAGVNWSSAANVKVALLNAGYTFSAGDTDFSSCSASQEGTSQTLGTKSNSAGAATGGNVTFSGIASGHTVSSIVVYIDNGGSKPLLAFFDTGTGLPLTTTGADITIHWNGGSPTGLLFSI